MTAWLWWLVAVRAAFLPGLAINAGGDVPVCVECSDAQETERQRPAAEQYIRATLLQDILETTARNNEATREFEAIMGQFPSGSAHADGAQRIKNASSQLSAARTKMMTAHERLNDYVGRGIMLEDLIAAHDSVKTG